MASDDEASGDSYIKLISSEGHEFFLERRIALAGSKTMKTMLESEFREADEGVIRFPDISTHILEKVLQYMHYKVRYSDSNTRIPEFTIEPEIALELLVASSFLDC